MQRERFLSKQGLGNEIPFFICPYEPALECAIASSRHSLATRLAGAGIKILEVNLLDVALDLLRDRGILEHVLQFEPEHERLELKELLQSVLYPQDHLVPAILARIERAPDILIISGVGEVFPFVRAHAVLNNLQSAAGQQLTVMFFPGTYTHALESGATLDVLGLRQDDRYYRAFNILEYEV